MFTQILSVLFPSNRNDVPPVTETYINILKKKIGGAGFSGDAL